MHPVCVVSTIPCCAFDVFGTFMERDDSFFIPYDISWCTIVTNQGKQSSMALNPTAPTLRFIFFTVRVIFSSKLISFNLVLNWDPSLITSQSSIGLLLALFHFVIISQSLHAKQRHVIEWWCCNIWMREKAFLQQFPPMHLPIISHHKTADIRQTSMCSRRHFKDESCHWCSIINKFSVISL